MEYAQVRRSWMSFFMCGVHTHAHTHTKSLMILMLGKKQTIFILSLCMLWNCEQLVYICVKCSMTFSSYLNCGMCSPLTSQTINYLYSVYHTDFFHPFFHLGMYICWPLILTNRQMNTRGLWTKWQAKSVGELNYLKMLWCTTSLSLNHIP